MRLVGPYWKEKPLNLFKAIVLPLFWDYVMSYWFCTHPNTFYSTKILFLCLKWEFIWSEVPREFSGCRVILILISKAYLEIHLLITCKKTLWDRNSFYDRNENTCLLELIPLTNLISFTKWVLRLEISNAFTKGTVKWFDLTKLWWWYKL